jgi:hypothetical protein
VGLRFDLCEQRGEASIDAARRHEHRMAPHGIQDVLLLAFRREDRPALRPENPRSASQVTPSDRERSRLRQLPCAKRDINVILYTTTSL